MRSLLLLAAFAAVIGLAFLAYRENYATQQALKDADRLQREIGALREALTLQRAEWAFLNRPDRLAELIGLNFDRLGLLPMIPEQFAAIAEVPLPPPPEEMPALSEPVDVAAPAASQDQPQP
jgi:hypothetical protein